MGRRIVITGVSRGLGEAMALALAASGHQVLGCARSESSLVSLRERLGAGHWLDCVDVSDDAQVADWSRRRLASFGVPDLIVNNAAVITPSRPLWEIDAQQMQDILQVNIAGVANLIRHFVPAMIARGSGVIVNFSSGWGRSTNALVAPYCATKWAIEGMTRALAQELPQGMAAVPLNPGIIDTDMLRACFGDAAGNYPGAEAWARRAVPLLLGLGPADNGKPLTVPQ